MITIIFGHCMTVSAILRKDSRRIVRKSDRNSGRACSMQNVAHCYFNIEITKTESLQDSVDSFDIEMAIRKILRAVRNRVLVPEPGQASTGAGSARMPSVLIVLIGSGLELQAVLIITILKISV